MTYGHGSVTYRVDLDGQAGESGSFIVRTSVDSTIYRGTRHNIDVLRDLGLPVPVVVDADLTQNRYPFAYMIMEVIAGRDLRYELDTMSRDQMSELAGRIVGFERDVMSLAPGGGYGFVPIGWPGRHARWVDAVRADRIEVLKTTEPDLMPFARKLTELLSHAESRLDGVPPTCFLDDLTTKNVMVRDGVLQGLVDFDVVCYGDPVYWLALTQVAVLSDTSPKCQFYVDELMRFWQATDADRANFALYCALHAVEFVRHDNADSVWRSRLIEASEKWLAEAR
ncbi:Phosphotransferase enzyme family protein [Amycolatopsis lurida]|uniref:Aminoglycoside phosphotransferase domain-containing protein n=2 Tax=Amycolatopsis lurida TaxID=31959 RepID=A0A2P2G175_AMYLU|nr:hypothetical protein BB31_03220 [Amycolatopsis lurida NRRL 2430]SEE04975.1 Phosphotransferase enzyme family protein [Amycolatopsis lurida]